MTASEKMVDIIRGIQNGRQGHAGHLVYVPSIMNKKQIDDILTAYEAEKDEKESIIESLESEIARLESEKSLLEKTRAWHQHGAVAPSCVGCPTAEAEIESGKYTTVITERLEKYSRLLGFAAVMLHSCEQNICRHKKSGEIYGKIMDIMGGALSNENAIAYLTGKDDHETN